MSQVMHVMIYGLCLVASTACTWLLLRGYLRSHTRLLLWVGLCFAFLSLNCLAVLFDILIYPEYDLQALRHAASLLAVGILLFGLVWEAE